MLNKKEQLLDGIQITHLDYIFEYAKRSQRSSSIPYSVASSLAESTSSFVSMTYSGFGQTEFEQKIQKKMTHMAWEATKKNGKKW